GFYDKRMEKVIPKQRNSMEFAVASLDYNLGNFIRYLEGAGVLKDTVFYIFPDHTMMGYGNEVISTLMAKKRKLYVITNAEQHALSKTEHDTFYQIDLPRFILNGAGIKTNAQFLTDLLPEKSDKIKFIEQHKKEIATLNAAALPQ